MLFFNSYNTVLNILRVGYLSKRSFVFIPYSKFIIKFIDKLMDIRYISHYEFRTNRLLCVYLVYDSNKLPIFRYTKLWYRQSLRTYISYKKLFLLYKFDYNTVYLLSTTDGLLTQAEAIDRKLGGELVCVLYS